MDISLGITVILRGVSGAAIVAAVASTDKLLSRKSVVCAVRFGRGSQFRYFPVGVVSEDVVVVGDRDKGKVEIFDQPPRWSRDSSEDFIIVGSGEVKVFDGMVGIRCSNHAATFFCLDRVITFRSGGCLILLLYASRISAACSRSASWSHVSSSAVYPFHRIR